MSDLVADTRALVRRAGLTELDALFDDAFRFAIAGLVKAGKSTLLNALIGERLAPTDAGECTRIVSWYRHGGRYEVVGVGHDGELVPLRFERRRGLEVDLAGRDHGDFERLDVSCPTPRLTGQTLIDLPGHGSLSADVSARAQRFLGGTVDGRRPVDAVIYLTRHHHPTDVAFLEAFQGDLHHASATSAIAVLSRADELGGARPDAMSTARRVADTLAVDPRMRRLCADVVPVAGLLAETAATLRNDEIAALRTIAASPDDVRRAGLLSVDRFAHADDLGATAEVRQALVGRLGIFGLRVALDIVERTGGSPDALTSGLAAASGIGDLRESLERRFFERAGVLRARAALQILAESAAVIDDADLAADLDRIRSTAHELRELQALDVVRSGAADLLGATDVAAIERLLGGDGPSLSARLGADRHLDPAEARSMLLDERRRWATVAESPFATSTTVELTEVAMRTCDSLLVGAIS